MNAHGDTVIHQLCLIDEVLTGDSSRMFEPMDQKHYDKQYLRNYLESKQWDAQSRFPLPREVKTEFINRYDHIKKLVEYINNYALIF
jgi:phosphoribosylaminoimidazole-succinocarboxamide synthase